ncbi:MAG: hypothetical protein AAGI11_20570 [Pseudomonadota bacterium]
MRRTFNGYKSQKTSVHDVDPDQVPLDIVTEIVLHGKLPCVILMPDSLSQDRKATENDPIAIKFGRYMAELRLRKLGNEDQRRWGMSAYIEDMFGDLTYSVFQLKIHSCNDLEHPLNHVVCDENNNVDEDRVTQLGAHLINRFLDIYRDRHGNSKDWIPQMTYKRLSPWHHSSARNRRGDPLWGLAVLDYRGTGVGLGTDLPEQERVIMQALLYHDFTIEQTARYMQLTNRYIALGDFSTSCVMLATSVESWIFREVRKSLRKKGLSEDEIESMLTKVEGGKIKNVSKEDALSAVLGDKSFKSSHEYQRYLDNVVEVRDSIVHARLVELDQASMNRMIRVTDRLKEYLSNRLQSA